MSTTEKTAPEPDAVVVTARDALRGGDIACRISATGKAIVLQSGATYSKARKLLDEAGLQSVSLYNPPNGSGFSTPPANGKAASVESIQPSEQAKALMQLLTEAKIAHRPSPRNSTAILVSSPEDLRRALERRKSRPELASVQIYQS